MNNNTQENTMADGTFNTDPLFNVRNYITACEAGEAVFDDALPNGLARLEKVILLNQIDKTEYTNALLERTLGELNTLAISALNGGGTNE